MDQRMVERRWERRLLCADLVQIDWKCPEAKGSATALLEDISPAGACLQTDVPLPVNAEITVHHGRAALQGTISYCSYREIGYFTGITFDGSQRWSRKMFCPKHLVDPASLDNGIAES